ncbi:hypothetical protein WG66_016718 [Moniliophthora roreri]|nr:hypothetical protein WG66_016718 [Moniliophthora roreri]
MDASSGATSSRASIERLFRSTITSSDRSVLEQLVKDVEKELTSYQAEIDKLTASLEFLKHKRDGARNRLLQYRSSLSPVHRLPPEVLQHIFGMIGNHLLKPSKTPDALAVSATCGRWRDVAISTPFLWSFISINFARWKRNYRVLVSFTQLFMERSRSCPLELALDFQEIDVVSDEMVPSLKNLVLHSNRWRSLKLRHIHKGILAHKILKPIVGRLPLLSFLKLYGPYGQRLPNDFRCDLFSDCPSLSSIEFQPFNPLRPEVRLPTEQIKSCVVFNSSSDDAFRSISSFPSVERLEIECCGGREYGGDHLVIPSVNHLTILASTPEQAYGAFKYTTLPQLTSPKISRGNGASDTTWKHWDKLHISNFFIRSACKLTSLSLRYVPISDDQLIHFLRLMPSLESLCVEESADPKSNQTITQRFFNRLAISHHNMSPHFLPKLTAVRLVLHEDGLVENVLPKTLISGWVPDARYASEVGIDSIKSIDIMFIAENEDPVETLISKLRWMRGAGVMVTVAAQIIEFKEGEDVESGN